jgi:hypothetical protein
LQRVIPKHSPLRDSAFITVVGLLLVLQVSIPVAASQIAAQNPPQSLREALVFLAASRGFDIQGLENIRNESSPPIKQTIGTTELLQDMLKGYSYIIELRPELAADGLREPNLLSILDDSSHISRAKYIGDTRHTRQINPPPAQNDSKYLDPIATLKKASGYCRRYR